MRELSPQVTEGASILHFALCILHFCEADCHSERMRRIFEKCAPTDTLKRLTQNMPSPAEKGDHEVVDEEIK